MSDNKANGQAAPAGDDKPQFNIQRIYIKGISVECPNSPQVFREQWKPDINLQINVDKQALEQDFHQVVLKITVTVKNEDKTAILIEVDQAGVFLLKNFQPEQVQQMLGAFCPNVLFPYAREVVSEFSVRSGFPPVYLAPVNFDAVYAEQLRQQQKKQAESGDDNAADNP